MSRIGKKPVKIPDGVEVKISDNVVEIKGPKGELRQCLPEGIFVGEKNRQLVVVVKKKTKRSAALWGLSRALLQNNILGVLRGFEKQMEIQGVGFKAVCQGEKLKLEIGFSHPFEIKIPGGLEVKVDKNIIIVSGPDKEKVGQFAANIRKIKPPEPYKGKGIRYLGEIVRRKEGKKAGATTATT